MINPNTKKSAEITILRNGPIKVSGKFTLIGIDGVAIQTENPKELFLCACGRSQKKPLCDGSHNTTIFR